MIAKLVAAAAVIAATVPAFAADFDARAEAPRVYVEQQERVYAPGEVVVPARRVPIAPRAPLLEADPADSYAYYDGPAVTYDDRYATDRVIRTAPMFDPYGPVCAPGTLVRMPDGRTWLCQ